MLHLSFVALELSAAEFTLPAQIRSVIRLTSHVAEGVSLPSCINICTIIFMHCLQLTSYCIMMLVCLVETTN